MEFLKKLTDGRDLTEAEAEQLMQKIINNELCDSVTGAILAALAIKKESASEIVGFVRTMRKFANKVNYNDDYLIDLCGTGGDNSGTFNISTAASIVAASCGAKVAKHGNRSVSSKCGSADVLGELGVKTNLASNQAENCLKKYGFTFLFAPLYHPSMKNVSSIRKELGIRTFFNIIGPLCNPCDLKFQMIGVFDSRLCIIFADVLIELGYERALIVHSDGLDEASVCKKTYIMEINKNKKESYYINPQDFGITESQLSDLKGGDAKTNAKIIQDILNGEKSPKSDCVVLNSGLALYTCGIADTIKQGINLSKEAINSGKAREKLEELKIV